MLQWSRSKLRIVFFIGHEIFCTRCKFDRVVHLLQPLIQIIECDINYFEDMFFFQCIEYHDVIDPVEKLGGECSFQCVLEDTLAVSLRTLHTVCRCKTDSTSKFFHMSVPAS